MAGKEMKCPLCHGTGSVPDKSGGTTKICRTCCGTGSIKR